MEAAATFGAPHVFRRGGCSLRDFMDNEARDADTHNLVGAKIISYFCMEDGRYNGFHSGIALAVEYLERSVGCVLDSGVRLQCLKSLRELLNAGATENQLVEWAKSYFA